MYTYMTIPKLVQEAPPSGMPLCLTEALTQKWLSFESLLTLISLHEEGYTLHTVGVVWEIAHNICTNLITVTDFLEAETALWRN